MTRNTNDDKIDVITSSLLNMRCCFFFQFLSEEALANELAAYFYSEIGDKGQSIEHLLQAHKKYQEWVSLPLTLLCLIP